MLLRLTAGEKLRGAALAGVGVGFVGVAVLLQPSGARRRAASRSASLSAVMWSVGSFAAARLTMPADPFASTTYEMLAGGLRDAPVRPR